jgi:hypothetical protein
MDKAIVGYVVSSLEVWRENEKVGEEVRLMQEAIENHLITELEPALEVILDLIDKYPDDKELGSQLRKIYIPLKVHYEGKTITL